MICDPCELAAQKKADADNLKSQRKVYEWLEIERAQTREDGACSGDDPT
jgi:hypothetical protein